jgi:hypothetical protein
LGADRDGARAGVSAIDAAVAAAAAATQQSPRAEQADAAAGGGGVACWLASKLGVAEEFAASAPLDCSEAAASRRAPPPPLRGWRLALLAERTPAQMVQVHLRARDWGSALQLCKAAGLHPDAVYRARWAAAPVSKVNIQVGWVDREL